MKTCNCNFKPNMAVLQPITINHMEVRNRFVMPGMGTLFGEPDCTVGDRFVGYIEARAKGGLGLIIVEYTAVVSEGRAATNELGIWDDRFIPGLKRLTEAAHKHGAKIGIQLHHAGRGTSTKTTGLPVYSASATEGTKGQVANELSKEKIQEYVEAWGAAAKRAKEAGFDCVEIHGAHGYLIHQFISPLSNLRTDEYGGSRENRMRFPVEIVKSVRKAVGPDFPITFRISAYDVLEGGRTVDDTVEEVKILEEAGIDLINVSDAMLESAYMIITGGAVEPGFLGEAAEKVKKAVNIPVCVVGKIHVPEIAEDIVGNGKADMVAIGRAAIVDPEFVNKVKDGRFEDIRQCIHCLNACYSEPVQCTQNPYAGHEYEYNFNAATEYKNVVVVGGGAAGLEVAVTLAKRCHKVTLLEKEETLGGQVMYAAKIPHKGDFANVIDFRIREAGNWGVNIVTGVEGTPNVIRRYKPDAVVIATGATPIIPPIPGADNKDLIVTAPEVLSGKKEVKGENLVVVGGGAVGSETANYYAQQGKKVTIIEMLPQIAGDVPFGNKIWLLKDLEDKNVRVMTSTTVKEFKNNVVVVEVDGKTEEVPADTVIMAIGSRPNNALVEEVKAALPGIDVYTIGDALRVRRIQHAVAEGAVLGHKI